MSNHNHRASAPQQQLPDSLIEDLLCNLMIQRGQRVILEILVFESFI